MRRKMVRRARVWHRWLGFVFGLQFLLWTLGGLYFSWTSLPNVRGDDIRKAPQPLSLADLPSAGLGEAMSSFRGLHPKAEILDLRWSEDVGKRGHFLVRYLEKGVEHHARLDPEKATLLPDIEPEEAGAIALNGLTIPARVAEVRLLERVGQDHEYREKPLPAYAVRLSGEKGYTVYVGRETGQIHNIRNTKWRVFDFLWMLHIMDYRGRDDINNRILRLASVLGLITLASGYLLFFLTRRRRRKIYPAAILLLLLAARPSDAGAQTQERMRPRTRFQQVTALEENSGMILWKGRLWQHVDGGGGPLLFETDTTDGRILRTVRVGGTANRDWEDIAQDTAYIYVGDFGNNADGARKDLAIYRVRKADIAAAPDNGEVPSQKIGFRYPDMPDSVAAPNRTDHDCEAMVCLDGRLLLFTKQWASKATVLYSLPAEPGEYTAERLDSFDTDGMVTGADIDPSTGRIVLTGYTPMLARFLWLLYDFPGGMPFRGRHLRVPLAGPAQTESVAFIDSDRLFLGSERFRILPARIEILEIGGLLPSRLE
ncbi:MAG: hypothetical protein EBZ67_01835 [Chitinophagia bacterium]|nr:hypothetical protein [Chitinophagia bacterium]